MNQLEKLYASLKLRQRPEDVAEIILEVLKNDMSSVERKILNRVAKGALKRKTLGYTSMSQEFSEAVGAKQQINTAIEIFNLKNVDKLDGNNIEEIKDFLNQTSHLIFKDVGKNNFVADRLNKVERKELGLDLSKRAYNKKWRLLKRLENKLEIKKVEFQKIAKHGLVHHLEFEEFAKDLDTACFIAYYNSRCNLRSVFTNKSQVRPFDEICDLLFKRCLGQQRVSNGLFRRNKMVAKKANANWYAISYIYTSQNVLQNLSDHEKGILLGKWTSVIQEIAKLLGTIWEKNHINRKTMIVKRGDDSTTWNNTAGAWNKARDQWMNLIYALGLDFILEEVCFGKVMRLMAADVVAWHKYSGGNLDPNTFVWNKLPLPWEVFKANKKCTKAMVVKYCKAAGIDAEKSGWIAPKKHGIEKYKPTPELVHGVEVSNPFLATVLKKNKYFSGKNAIAFDPIYN